MSDIPWWVQESVEYYGFSNRVLPWEKHSEEMYSLVSGIHYPPRAHVFYVVDALQDDGSWKELKGEHYVKALAENAARRRAYNDRIPHRVRIVVSYE